MKYQACLCFIVFYLLIMQTGFTQDCKIQAADKPSVLTRGTDAVATGTGKMNAAEMAKMKVPLAKAENWTKKILANFTGAKLLYYNSFFPDYLNNGTTNENLYKATGMKSYFSSQMMFFAYYCYDNSSTIHTEAESGSSVYVNFNNVFALGFTEDAGVYIINGKPAFKAIQKKRSEGRIDFYEQRAQNNANAKMFTANDYIILRNSDEPVFIPVTRKEYLQQMLRDADNSGSNDAKLMDRAYTQNVKQFEEEMKVYRAMDKTYTPEKEAKRRKWFEEDQEKLKKIISKTGPDVDAAKEVIKQYLKKPAVWLNRSCNNFYGYSTYTAAAVTQFIENMDKIRTNGAGETEEETPQEIVAINPAYFNKALGSDVPQLILVHLRNGSYAHMVKVDAFVKQPGALAPLAALLNPGKSSTPAEIPTETISTYALNYLPKLKTLPPLTEPAGMKHSAIPVAANNTGSAAGILNFTIPPRSAKLDRLPRLLTAEEYTGYIQQLHTAISTAMKPGEKNKADELAKKSKQLSNTAFAARLQNAPVACLYLYSKAVAINVSDALTANNFSAFLIMSGMPEKSIPILDYWNGKKPGEVSILANLGNAYYRLGDPDKAMKYLQQAVQKDSLHATANKILCMIYLKKGDPKNAKDHGTRSLTGSYDEQVLTMLRQLDNKTKPGEIMGRWPVKEFPLLKRIKLPAMPAKLDDMGRFTIDLAAEKRSLEITIADMESKVAGISEDLKQKALTASFTKGFSPLRVKAQYIIMDGMQTYHREMIRENDAFNYNLQLITAPFSAKVKTITKKYSDQLNKLEGGEAGDEDKITALELASCKEINAEKEKYLGDLSVLMNGYAQRKEYVSRKFYAEYANWVPFWMPETSISFPSIEKDYLKDMLNILSEYPTISKTECTPAEPLPNKEGKLQVWQDEFCANFKGEIGMGAATIKWDCNSWAVEGGEGLAVELGVNYADDGSFEDFIIGAGPGVSWDITAGGIIKAEAGGSVKEFIKIGNNRATGNWEIKDFGFKADVSLQGNIGTVKHEIKIVELSAAVNAGLSAGGVVAPILNIQ
jgi:tetratricopeptide (TPR) repeat protein